MSANIYKIRSVVWCLAVVLGWFGPGCEKNNNKGEGEQGESCASTSDCAGDLACINSVCQERQADAGEKADANEQIITGGDIGESCAARADCILGLACIRNVCVKPIEEGNGADAGADAQTPLGSRGESCQTRNDCESGLVCVKGACSVDNF